MDSSHTGSDNTSTLLRIFTPKFCFSIEGPIPDVNYLMNNKDVQIKITAKQDYTAQIYSPKERNLVSYTDTKDNYPLFFEQKDYDIIIERSNDEKMICKIENGGNEKHFFIDDSQRVKHTIPLDNIGDLDIVILLDDLEYLKLTIKVYSSKIDYQNYRELLEDINNEVYNLAFDFYKTTYFHGTRKDVGNSLTEFFTVINQIFDNLNQSIMVVLNIPHHLLKKDREVLKYYVSKKVDREGLKWINKHPQYMKNINEKIIFEKIYSVKSSLTYDTYENRLVKYIIKSIIKRLNLFKNTIERINNNKAIVDDNIENIKTNIEKMIHKLEQHLNYSFLKDVGDIYTMNSFSLVLNMAPGYKDVYKYYIMLLNGLMISEYSFKISIKDSATLYEYWCFIKLNSILREKYYLKQNIIKFDTKGLTVTLKKGESSLIKYRVSRISRSGDISLIYNERFNTPTTDQIPDIILSLHKPGSHDVKYVFDAKYKIDNSKDMPGPEEDDINTMHRYRDAIVDENGRIISGAFVLFPYSDEDKYKEHRFYKSIEQIKIGGLPFLPRSTELVRKFIDEIINNFFGSPKD